MLAAASCSFGDIGCQINNSINDTLSQIAATLASWLGGMLKGALNADSQVTIFDTSGNGHFANQGFATQFGFWLVVMTSVVMLVALVQLIIGMVTGNGRKILRVGIAVLASIPTTSFALLAFDRMNQLMNLVTDSLMNMLIGDQEGGLPKALLNMTGLGTYIVPDGQSSDPWAVLSAPTMDGGSGIFRTTTSPVAAMILVIGCLLIACGFLAIAMLIRVFGLAALAVLAPIGIMFVGQPKLGAWAVRWVEVVVGLLLAKPLAAAIIGVAVAIGGGAPTETTPDSTVVTGFWGVFAAFVGLLIAAAAPALTIGLTRFASSEIQQSVARRPSVSGANYKVQMAGGTVRSLTRVFSRGGTSTVAAVASRPRPLPRRPPSR